MSTTTLFLGKAAKVTGKTITFVADAILNMTDSELGVSSTIASNARIASVKGILESSINTKDSNMDLRMKAEISARESAITSEYNRAYNAELLLSNKVDFLTSNIDPIALDSLTEIVKKFGDADESLITTIQNLAASAGTNLTNETNRAKGIEEQLRSDLTTEVNRATGAEGSLATALTAEASRATDAEGSLATSLTTEKNRATGAEGSLATALTTEVNRATGAEGSLATALTTEVNRATGAEGSLATALTTEVNRATGAEGSLVTALTTEVNRATGAEGSLATALTAEASRATGAEDVMRGKLKSLYEFLFKSDELVDPYESNFIPVNN
jgi:hypothetical protein